MKARGESGVRRSSRMPSEREVLRSLRQRALDRSMMTPEQQLRQPEMGLNEAGVIPDMVDFTPPGMAVPASPQIALPIHGFPWLKKQGIKTKTKDIADSVTGGFDKIKKMVLDLPRAVRGVDAERSVVKTRIGNPLSKELPVRDESAQSLMRQKALQDTRAGLKQRAQRISEGGELPEGGFFFGIEPLEDTVLKGASLRKGYEEFPHGFKHQVGAPVHEAHRVASKFGAPWNASNAELREYIDLDARKRAKVDEFLSRKGLAPESLVVQSPKATYMVQDKAEKTVKDLNASAFNQLEADKEAIRRGVQSGKITPDAAEELIFEAKDRYHQQVRESLKKIDDVGESVKNLGAYPSDLHHGNVMYDRFGNPKIVDTQGFYMPAGGNTHSPAEPIEKDHWRYIRKK